MPYELLEAYRQGKLPQLWQDMKAKIIVGDATLSPLRAGEIAAALIANRAANELAKLELDIVGRDAEDAAFELRDWLIENYEIKRDLVELSGTRTLLADMAVYSLSMDREEQRQ